MNRMANLLISSDVHYAHFGEDNYLIAVAIPTNSHE